MASPVPATRTSALDRMTQALELAKRARDRGANVSDLRRMLKEARSAFEHGDYAMAASLADSMIAQLGSYRGSAPIASTPTSPAPPPPSSDLGTAAGRLAEATDAVKQPKAHGFNVQAAKASLKQAKRAFKARDYGTTVQFASQAIELSASTGRVRP